MSEPRAGLQLIVFGERNKNDFPNVLREVRATGFSAIECGDLFQAHGEAEARKLLENNSLTVSGVHFGYSEFTDAERLASHIAFCRAMGVKNVICSGVEDRTSIDGYRRSSRLFNEIGRQVAGEGLVFHYHNHAWEFESLPGGGNGMEILEQETDSDFVKFNIDVFWVWFGGGDPAHFIRRHKDRAGYFHFKDGSRDADGKPIFLELGHGSVDLPDAIKAARSVGADWIVAEQDRTTLTHYESIGISRSYMRDILNV